METFWVNLSNVAGATLNDGQGLGTITNDDSAAVEFNLAAASDAEANGGNLPILLVNSNLLSDQLIEVNVSGGTATLGTDYNNTVVIVIPAGVYDGTPVTAIPIGLTVIDDDLYEADETIFLQLANPGAGLIIGDANGDSINQSLHTYTITNDDSLAVSLIHSMVSASPNIIAADGVVTSTITVTLRDALGNPVPGKTIQLTSNRAG